MYSKIKPIFDFWGALFLLLTFSWLFIILAILTRITMGSPILFAQMRAGRNGKLFKLYKFRSMTDKRDKDGNLLPDAERICKFGIFLRRTSFDELPQLFNVLKGDMSFIGPRPLLPEYLPLYTPYHAKRHQVIPGMTGWSQVNGRNDMKWSKKFDLDVYYVEHFSWTMDLKIFFMTFSKIFVSKNEAVIEKVEDIDDLHFWDRINAQKDAAKAQKRN